MLGKDLIELIIAGTGSRRTEGGARTLSCFRTGPILGRRREIEARRHDGKEFKAELSVTALRRRDGVCSTDFSATSPKRSRRRTGIRQSEKMEAVGQLTGGIAHDFNNMLTVITGTIEILADAVANEPQLAAITKMIDEAAARGAELTQHLLAFARKQPLQPREIDINTLIVDTAKLLRPTLGEQIEIELVLGRAVLWPPSIPTSLRPRSSIWRSTLATRCRTAASSSWRPTNAYLDDSYADIHEDVQPGHYALIAVSDTGTGIPAAILDKVFDPFFTSKGRARAPASAEHGLWFRQAVRRAHQDL